MKSGEYCRVDGYFETAVGNAADILLDLSEAYRRRNVGIQQQVVGAFVVDVDRSVHTVAPHGEVDAHVGLVCGFPPQVAVGELENVQRLMQTVVPGIVLAAPVQKA